MEKDKEMGRVITVGTFDGMHIGHQYVVSALSRYGKTHGLEPLVVTFDRHPLEVIAPGRTPRLLESRADRNLRLNNLGVEVAEVEFTPGLSSLTAREWMEILRDKFRAEAIITGYDNTFGSDGRNMTPDDYKRLGEELGIKIIREEKVPEVSSSIIRRKISEGNVEEAARLLGRDFMIRGMVVKGRQLGRELGFPTANVDMDSRYVLPAPGVYSGELNGDKALINIGDNPTVNEGNPVTVEAHILDFDRDIYGEKVSLSFSRRLRDEKKFNSLDELKAGIEADVERVRQSQRDKVEG